MFRFALPLAGVALAAFAIPASAQSSLTTTFADNNGRSSSGATVYFDMQLNVGIGITAFDLNCITAAGANGTVDVYVTAAGGTYLGNQQNASAWTQVGSSATFVTVGRGQPTPAPLLAPIVLAPGTYGIAIAFNGVGVAYTNGNGTNQSYSNADITLTLGSATAALFSSSLFDPRVFNGTIYYTVGGNFARAVPFGSGCGSPAVGLRGLARPVIGANASAETFDLPANNQGGIVLLGFGAIQPGIDLTPLGMPTCFLNISPQGSVPFVPGPTAVTTLPIPADPGLAGASVFLQSATVAPGANSVGVLTSNGLEWILDTQ